MNTNTTIQKTTAVIALSYSKLHEVASTDSTRYVLNGIFVDAESKKLVATDGKVMTIAPIMELSGDTSGIISIVDWKRLVADHKRNKSYELKITLEGDQVRWEGGNGQLIVGNYPNWKHVVPKDTDGEDLVELSLSSHLLHQAAKSAGWSKRSIGGVMLRQKGYGDSFRLSFGWDPEVKSVLMPMRSEKDDDEINRVLGWLRSRLGQRPNGSQSTVAEHLKRMLKA